MYDVIIIGAGPAGLSCAIYAARGGLKTLIIEKMSYGGQMCLTDVIENYPGCPSVNGFTLGETMKEQALSFGAELIASEVTAADYEGEVKTVFTADGNSYSAKTLVIACGANAKKLGVAREAELTGSGVSYCATCDGRFYRKRTVAVVGGGNTAAEDALYLARFASKVYLIHRRDKLRASPSLAARLKDNGVEILWNTRITELSGADRLEGLVLDREGERTTLAVDGLFVAVGQQPQSAVFAPLCNESGYIPTDSCMETSAKGVFAVGDVTEKPLRQVITAAADGAVAGECIVKRLLDI